MSDRRAITASGRPGPARRDLRGATRHDEAMIQAEVRRLARALRPYRVLRRDALQRKARAARWHEGAFERALDAAVESGAIKQLPRNFYGCPNTERVPSSENGQGERGKQ